MSFQPTRVIVIGAGWAGIAAAKTYLQVNPQITLTVIDAGRTVGGVWAVERCYPGLVANSPVGLFDFSDLPMRDALQVKDWEELPALKVHEYLETYARKFGVLERCRLQTRVTGVRRNEHHPDTWTVDVVDEMQPVMEGSGKPSTESLVCDKLIIATGLHSNPRQPEALVSDFRGPVLHTADLGRRSAELLQNPAIQRISVYGGGKSAADVVNMCISAGKHVDWIISDQGNGPGVMMELRLKGGLHVGQFVGRWKDIFLPAVFNVNSFWSRFFYSGKNRLGAWLIQKFWAKASDKQLQIGPYKRMTVENRQKLTPLSKSALYPLAPGIALQASMKISDELAKEDGLITVHRAHIDSIQDSTLTLSSKDSLACDAVVFATGWTSKDELFSSELGLSLGVAKPVEEEHEDQKSYWASLQERADTEIVSLFPLLQDSPLNKTSREQLTPLRLYRYMLPSALAARQDRSLIFVGLVTSIQTAMFSEVSALWAVSWLENLVDLGVPSRLEDIDYEIARVMAWSRRRNLTTEPLATGEIQLVMDTLMNDMGLRAQRNGGLGVKDFLFPYRSQLYRGMVDQVLQKSSKN